MDIEKLIEQLKKSADFEDYPVVASFAAIIEKKYLREAATALSTLQAENKRLNKIVCSIPTTPDSGRTVSQYDKEMSMCVYLGDLEAENEKLWGEFEYEKERANAYYEECGQWEAENEQLRSDLRRLQTERDALLAANQHLMAEREQLTAERDAAVSDVSAILAEVEEIRRGYGVDNADADIALADLCGNYCAKCSNNCYEEAEDYRCKNYEWRGMKED